MKSTPFISSARRRILLVDDQPIMRLGLAGIINQQDDLVVCCEAVDTAQAIQQLTANVEPALMIIDISLEGKSGLELIRDIHAVRPQLRILVFSKQDETIYAERALRAGAHGYVMKTFGAEAILGAIRKVLGGKLYVSEKMSARIIDLLSERGKAQRASPVGALTDREFEVYKLIGEGCSTREVAKRLHLSPKTVDVYRQHIKEKFGLHDSTALIQHAVRWIETQDRAQVL